MKAHTFQDLLVSPQLCKQLQERGFTPNTAIRYVPTENGYEVFTKIFDYLSVYDEDIIKVPGLSTPNFIPAYHIGELLPMLPNFYVGRTNNIYEVSIDVGYDVPVTISERYADAIAKQILEFCKTRSEVILAFNSATQKANQ
jgi:hypothetical protein